MLANVPAHRMAPEGSDEPSGRFVGPFIAEPSSLPCCWTPWTKRDITDAGGTVGPLPAEKNRAHYLISPSGHP
jgi:hypothetical protein